MGCWQTEEDRQRLHEQRAITDWSLPHWMISKLSLMEQDIQTRRKPDIKVAGSYKARCPSVTAVIELPHLPSLLVVVPAPCLRFALRNSVCVRGLGQAYAADFSFLTGLLSAVFREAGSKFTTAGRDRAPKSQQICCLIWIQSSGGSGGGDRRLNRCWWSIT